MLRGFKPGKIYLATGYTDLRRGIDGLAGIVQEQFELNAFEDALFLFCGRQSRASLNRLFGILNS